MSRLFHTLKSDEALMLAYQRGDSAAFETVYTRHKNSLFAFLLNNGAQRDNAEEIAHDAWTAIIRSIKKYQPRAKFKTYLYQVAHNKLIDSWRKQREQVSLNEDTPSISLSSNSTTEPDTMVAQQKTTQRLQTAVHALPDDQRVCFLLLEQGFSRKDIANITHSGEETVKSRLRYARQTLRQSLQDSV